MTRTWVDFVTLLNEMRGRRLVFAVWLFGLVLLAQPGAVLSAEDDLAALEGDVGRPPADVLQELNARNPVAARVNGREIRWRDVLNSSGDLAIATEDEARALFPVLLERVIDRELLAAAARRDGLAADGQVKDKVSRFEDEVLSRLYLERAITQATDRAQIWAKYQARIEASATKLEIRARHILVETRDEALALIAELENGAGFAALAARYSIGPSASRGGDLGYFDPARMVAAFSEAALSLHPGQHSDSPVKTPFGWHVIELVDLRQEGGVPFETLEAELQAEAKIEARQSVMRQLRADSQIEILSEPLHEP